MPEHKGIHIALISQYDAKLMPEYRTTDDNDSPATAHDVDTYIPNYTASQFWIRYACNTTNQGPETRFTYFKLYVAGNFVVAWGCGAQDEWMGETLFVPSDARSADNGSRQKLGLFFPRDVETTPDVPAFEIRVYRARARKRQERQYADGDLVRGEEHGVHLNPIAIVGSGEPRRFYSYALLDPKDAPYAHFRYHFRDYHELQNPGFVRQRGVRIVLPMRFDYRRFVDHVSDPSDFSSEVLTATPQMSSSPRRSTIRIVDDDLED